MNTFGAYQAYYQADLLSHKSSSSISWIGTTEGFLLGTIGVVTGPIFDRGHLYSLLLLGSSLIVFGMMMLSLASEYWHVFLSQGVCVGVGSGLLYVPSLGVLSSAFSTKRAVVIGIATSASSLGKDECSGSSLGVGLCLYLGGVVYPIAFRCLQPQIGFAWATRVIGLVSLSTFAISFAAMRVAKRQIPRQKPRSLIDTRAFSELPFTVYALALFFLYAGFWVPFFYVPSYAKLSLHLSDDLSFYMLAVTNAATLFGRILPAFLTKRMGAIDLFASSSLAGGILVLSWAGIHNLPGFVVFCILYGLLAGIITTLTTVMVPALSPSLNVVGTRLGMAYACSSVGVLVGSPIAAALSDITDGVFLGAQAWSGVTLVLGSLLLVYPWIFIAREKKT